MLLCRYRCVFIGGVLGLSGVGSGAVGTMPWISAHVDICGLIFSNGARYVSQVGQFGGCNNCPKMKSMLACGAVDWMKHTRGQSMWFLVKDCNMSTSA